MAAGGWSTSKEANHGPSLHQPIPVFSQSATLFVIDHPCLRFRPAESSAASSAESLSPASVITVGTVVIFLSSALMFLFRFGRLRRTVRDPCDVTESVGQSHGTVDSQASIIHVQIIVTMRRPTQSGF